MVANRTTDMFACLAKYDGEVVSVNQKGILVKYVNGEMKGVKLGRQFGKAEGSVYPHDVITKLKPGQKFVKGDAIAYNTSFFEQDFIDPKRIVLKSSLMARVALMESPLTHEDSSAISTRLSQRLKAKTTKVKSFTVNFKQEIVNPVAIGDSVKPDTVLLTISDEITSVGGTFNENDLAVLSRLSKSSPKAKYFGTIDRIEVLYHGDKEDMTTSLRTLADASDRMFAAEARAVGEPVITGSVNGDYRVKGTPLTLDNAEIKIYMTVSNEPGVGDKAVFGLQLKSTHSSSYANRVTDENGVEVDAIFGARSVANRIVESFYIIGTTSTLALEIGKRAVKAYRK